MITLLLNLVGSRLGHIVGLVLAVGLIFWLTIQYGQSIERNDRIQEDLQDNIETRGRIDESISDSPDDPSDALDWLRQRQTQ